MTTDKVTLDGKVLCCQAFADRVAIGLIEYYEGWNVVADGGAYALHDISYCPYCGEKLDDH